MYFTIYTISSVGPGVALQNFFSKIQSLHLTSCQLDCVVFLHMVDLRDLHLMGIYIEDFWISISWTCQKINMNVMEYENGFVSIRAVHMAKYIMDDSTNNMKIIRGFL